MTATYVSTLAPRLANALNAAGLPAQYLGGAGENQDASKITPVIGD